MGLMHRVRQEQWIIHKKMRVPCEARAELGPEFLESHTHLG
jgi:hypothetical protein